MTTASPTSDTRQKLRVLEKLVAFMESRHAADRQKVAAAEEWFAADQAVDELALRSCRGEVTGAVARRLAVLDRLTRARKRFGELATFKPAARAAGGEHG